MEMLLSVVVMSLLAVVVSAVLFLAATREEAAPPVPDERLMNLPSHFFASDQRPPTRPAVPIEVLLLQIERHVQLEQAAAEAFRDSPTAKTLRTATTSPLVH